MRCDYDGIVRYVRDNFDKNNFNDASGWNNSSDCNYDRSNDYMNAVCCGN